MAGKFWTDARDQRLRRAWDAPDRDAALRALAGGLEKPVSALKDRARRMGLLMRPPAALWTEQELAAVDALADLAPKARRSAVQALAERIGRSPDAVLARLRMRHRSDRARKRWTPAEDRRLRADVSAGRAFADLADEYGRSATALAARAVQLHASKSDHPAQRLWTPAEDAHLAQMAASGVDRAEMMFVLSRSAGAIKKRLLARGIRVPRARRVVDPLAAATGDRDRAAAGVDAMTAALAGRRFEDAGATRTAILGHVARPTAHLGGATSLVGESSAP